MLFSQIKLQLIHVRALQKSVKGAATIALYDTEVSAVSGKSLSDTDLFSLLLSDGLKLFVAVFQLEN